MTYICMSFHSAIHKYFIEIFDEILNRQTDSYVQLFWLSFTDAAIETKTINQKPRIDITYRRIGIDT